MDEKLQEIITAMVNNGESHDVITSVISEYKTRQVEPDVSLEPGQGVLTPEAFDQGKLSPAAETTAPAADVTTDFMESVSGSGDSDYLELIKKHTQNSEEVISKYDAINVSSDDEIEVKLIQDLLKKPTKENREKIITKAEADVAEVLFKDEDLVNIPEDKRSSFEGKSNPQVEGMGIHDHMFAGKEMGEDADLSNFDEVFSNETWQTRISQMGQYLQEAYPDYKFKKDLPAMASMAGLSDKAEASATKLIMVAPNGDEVELATGLTGSPLDIKTKIVDFVDIHGIDNSAYQKLYFKQKEGVAQVDAATAITPEQQEKYLNKFDAPDLFDETVEIITTGSYTSPTTGISSGGETKVIKNEPYKTELEETKTLLQKIRNEENKLLSSADQLPEITEQEIQDYTRQRLIAQEKAKLKSDNLTNYLEENEDEKQAIFKYYAKVSKDKKFTQAVAAQTVFDDLVSKKEVFVDLQKQIKHTEKSFTDPTYAYVLDGETITLENGKEIPKNIYNNYTNNIKKLLDYDQQINDAYKEVETATNKLNDVDLQLELLGKDYGTWRKFKANIGTGFSSIGMGIAYGIGKAVEGGKYLEESVRGVEHTESKMIGAGLDMIGAEFTDWKQKTMSNYANDVRFDDAFSSVNKFGRFFTQEIGQQIPILTTIITTGGTASPFVLGAYSMGEKYMEMDLEDVRSGKERSEWEKFGVSLGYGASEAILGTLPTTKILGRGKDYVNRAMKQGVLDPKDWIKMSFKEQLPRVMVYEPLLESSSEGLTQISQNLLDGKPIMENVDHAMFSGGMFGFMMSSSPVMAGMVMSRYQSPADYKKFNENTSQLAEINNFLQNTPNINPAVEKNLQNQKSKIEQEIDESINEIEDLVLNQMSPRFFNQYKNLTVEQQRLRTEAKEILESKDFKSNPSLKNKLIEDLNEKFNNLQNKKDLVRNHKSFANEFTLLENGTEAEQLRYQELKTQAEENVRSLKNESPDFMPSNKDVMDEAYNLYVQDNIESRIKSAKRSNGVNFEVARTNQDAKDAVNNAENVDDKQKEEIIAKIDAGTLNGVDDLDGKSYIFMENAISNERTSTIIHEPGHQVFKKILGDGQADFIPMVGQIAAWLEKTDPEMLNVIRLKQSTGATTKVKAEEFVMEFMEQVDQGKIDFDKTNNKKLASLFGYMASDVMSDNGGFNLELKGQADAVNFLINLAAKIRTGTLTEADIEAAKESDVIKAIDVDETADATIKKSIDKKTATNLALEADGDINNLPETKQKELTNQYELIAIKALGYVEGKGIAGKPKISREEAVSYVNQFLPGIVRRYNRKKGDFSTMIFGNIKPKRQAFYGKQEKLAEQGVQQRISDVDVEGKPRTDIASTDLTPEEAMISREAQAKKDRVTPRAKLFRDFPEVFDKELRDDFEVAGLEIFEGETPAVESKEFKKFTTEAFRGKTTAKVKKKLGAGKAYEFNVKKLASKLKENLPIQWFVRMESTVPVDKKQFTSPPKRLTKQADIDKAMLDDKVYLEVTTQGVNAYEFKDFTSKELADFILAPLVNPKTGKKSGLRGTRKTGLAEGLVDLFGRQSSPTAIKKVEKVKEKLPQISAKLQVDPRIKFSEDKFDNETNWKTIPQKLGLDAIKTNTLQGKQEAIDVLFFGNESLGLEPIVREFPKSFIIDNIGTFSNGGVNVSIKDSEGNKKQFTKNGKKIDLREYTLKDGTTIRNNNPKFDSKEIQLQVKPVGNFLFANKLQVLDAIDKTEKLANEEGVNAFAAEDSKVAKAIKRQSYKNLESDMKKSSFKEDQKEARQGFKEILSVFNELIQSNPQYAPAIVALMSSTSGGQGHFMRKGSIAEFFNTLNTINVEEHTSPASDLAKFLVNRMVDGNFDEYVDAALDGYFQGSLPRVFDLMLKGDGFNYIKNIPKEYRFDVLTGLKSVWIRYFNPKVNAQVRYDKKTKKYYKGIDPNVIILSNGKSIAENFGLKVDSKFLNPEVIAFQQKLLFEIFNGDITQAVAKQRLQKALPVEMSKNKTNKKVDIPLVNKSGVVKASEDMSMEDVLNKAASLDEALRNARNPKAPVKKIRVFDFDDTLARTKSNVLYTMPDGTTGKLTAEEFAKRGDEMLAEGAVWDFSEFNKVMDGKKGPLFEVAKKIQDARGSEDIFVLTARAPEASPAIKEFLDAIGLNIPLKNISGLGDSSPFAKSNWIVDKAAEGYNDFYFADDHAANVKAVSDAMSLMDVKSKTQLAKQNNIKFSEDSAKKLNWKTDENGYMNSNFKIKDKSYVVSLFPVDNKGDYRYEFELETETGSTQAITGTGNSIRVFSTVYNGLVDAINNNKKIKRVEFSADKSEPSRVRVYTSVMDRLSKDLGWNTDIWETTDWDGGGSFDFEITKPRKKQPAPVEKVLNIIDVKSETQKAKTKFSEDMSMDFNTILEESKGVDRFKIYSDVKAQLTGARKGKGKFFIPPSAEDFQGLLYATLGKGKQGIKHMQFYDKALLKPYAQAMENLATDRVNLMADFKALKKDLDVPKDLQKTTKSGFTNEQAVRVYLWAKTGQEIPGISKADFKELNDIVENDPKLKVFADQILSITKGDGYSKPGKNWTSGTITTDLVEILNTTKRTKYLETWQANVDLIFSKDNMNKLESIFGPKYVEALSNSLSRMKAGRNRIQGGNRLSNRVLDYINNSTGAIMFFNMRSALLQTISAANFINWSFNNPLKAGKAFANQPQYWKDFKTLMNSDYLVDRRNGLKLNINESEIADAAKTSKNKAKAVISYIIEKGYIPTKFADSFAIATGGATFYRNRINDLMKNEGKTEAEAKKQAMEEFRKTSEISQQSSDPSKISQQQSTDLGRVVLQFVNTPMQYARIQKRAAQDIINRRGDDKTNVSKIIYYGFLQNMIFNALQSGLFAIGFGDDDELSDNDEKKIYRSANGMMDSWLRGLGFAGVTVQVLKNLGIDIYDRSKRDRPEYTDAWQKLLEFSPAIKSKLSKFKGAAYPFDSKKRRQEVFDKGFSLDNPAYESAAKVITATTNIPIDRLFTKVNNIKGALDEDQEAWKSVAMILGWPEWQLTDDSKSSTNKSKTKVKRKRIKRKRVKRK